MNKEVTNENAGRKSRNVTGAGSGIGRAAVLRFARKGARVVVADLNAETARAVVDEIQAAGGTAVAVTGDVSYQAVVEQVVQTAVDTFGGVDVLVNNVAIADRKMAAADVTGGVGQSHPRQPDRAVPAHTCRVATHAGQRQGRDRQHRLKGGLGGGAAGTAYTVSKHGVIGLTRSLGVMYRDAGIRANAIAPGSTVTNIALVAEPGDPAARGPRTISPYKSSAGRIAHADEPAAVIVFLASDDASNIDGAILPVDNCWSAI